MLLCKLADVVLQDNIWSTAISLRANRRGRIPAGSAKATKQVAYAKIGGFGPTGSGKTTLMAMLALYLSKTYHGGAPVAFLDTEKGYDFVKPYFDQEGVEFLVDKTRAFIDLRDAHAQPRELSLDEIRARRVANQRQGWPWWVCSRGFTR